MDKSIRSRIRHIFLSPRPNFALMTASELLGMPFRELKREIADGSIVAVSTGMGQRLTREEMIVLAMRVWEQAVIEEALGEEASSILPEAMRLVRTARAHPALPARQLSVMADWEGTSVDDSTDPRARSRGLHVLGSAGRGGAGFQRGDAVAGIEG